MNSTIAQLQDAMNRHDADAVAALFAEDYRSEQPAHPNRGFGGPSQVAANWSGMFRGVPDLEVGVVKESTDGATSWSEWVWRGTRGAGEPFLMRGVIVMGLHEDGLIAWARLYMEPVEQGGAGVGAAAARMARR
jgi:ketosteroid isomerase-like protein